MIRQQRGHVVAISSSQYLDTFPNMVAYCTTKYGNTGFLNSLREEMCFYGYDDFLKCTAVHPTFIDTNPDLTKLHNSIFKSHTFSLNDADKIADLVVTGVRKEKFNVNVPCYDVLMCYVSNRLPRNVKTRVVYEALKEDSRDQYIDMRRKKLNL
jgi:short-subunit dehydrogenase